MKTTAFASITILACLMGCGTRSYVTAEESRYPVSMSSVVRDERGAVVDSKRWEKLGTLRVNYTTCTMLWSAIGLWNRTRDISDDVNKAVAKRHGEAVVNLRVEASGTFWEFFTLVGLLPDCANVRVRGDIVQRLDRPSALPAASTASGG